jgi:hypothetical protein
MTRSIAGLLLVIFSIGITPKQILHDFFAGHTDKRAVKTGNTSCQLSGSGYNCHCDNLVAESVFVDAHAVFNFLSFASFSSYVCKNISFSSVIVAHSFLRGPPATV